MKILVLSLAVLGSAALMVSHSQAAGKQRQKTQKEARIECKKENPKIRGKALRKCVKEKRGK
ncbi:MAG TPA: hypothetical protein VM432_08725 [Bdellovibrionales bacterium]|nr:hypothetical protein [Bdellovibrionales bacterium]